MREISLPSGSRIDPFVVQSFELVVENEILKSGPFLQGERVNVEKPVKRSKFIEKERGWFPSGSYAG